MGGAFKLRDERSVVIGFRHVHSTNDITADATRGTNHNFIYKHLKTIINVRGVGMSDVQVGCACL